MIMDLDEAREVLRAARLGGRVSPPNVAAAAEVVARHLDDQARGDRAQDVVWVTRERLAMLERSDELLTQVAADRARLERQRRAALIECRTRYQLGPGLVHLVEADTITWLLGEQP